MSDDIVNRLRCRYASGPIINGEPEFGWRDTSGPLEVILPTPIMKEAADEITRLRVERDQLRQYLDAAQRRGEELRAQVAALEGDAGRYRLIRDEMTIERGIDSNGKRGLMAWWTGIGVQSGSDEHIDAAIDAARKGEA